jgi:hypothetical protein
MSLTRTFLPMLGHTRGNRDAATCHFKCGNACAKDVCNTSENSYFRDIADSALSRRSILGPGRYHRCPAGRRQAGLQGHCPGAAHR